MRGRARGVCCRARGVRCRVRGVRVHVAEAHALDVLDAALAQDELEAVLDLGDVLGLEAEELEKLSLGSRCTRLPSAGIRHTLCALMPVRIR